MAIRPVKASEIPGIQDIFTAAWNLLKEFYNLKQDDPQGHWNDCLRRYSEVAQMGTDQGTIDLAKALAQTVFHFIEYRSKEKN